MLLSKIRPKVGVGNLHIVWSRVNHQVYILPVEYLFLFSHSETKSIFVHSAEGNVKLNQVSESRSVFSMIGLCVCVQRLPSCTHTAF